MEFTKPFRSFKTYRLIYLLFGSLKDVFRQSFWQYNISHGKALNKIRYGASSIICIPDNDCRDREREIGRKKFQLKEMSAFEVV